jgi:hypothetical protein
VQANFKERFKGGNSIVNKIRFSSLIVAVLVLVLLPTLVLAAPPLQGGSNYTIQADDTLSKIADKEYGNSQAFSAIVFYNNQRGSAGRSTCPPPRKQTPS